jgi:hypothetical protein
VASVICYCRSRLARIIARFYVISFSHKTKLLPAGKTPAGLPAKAKMRYSTGEPGAHPPLAGLFPRKQRRNPPETPYFPLRPQALA